MIRIAALLLSIGLSSLHVEAVQTKGSTRNSSASSAVTDTPGTSTTTRSGGIEIPLTSAQCPAAPAGHTLHAHVKVVASDRVGNLTTITGVTLAELAAKCRRTVFCDGFDTLGNLWTGLPKAKLEQVPASNPCYGIYIQRSPKKWTGLPEKYNSELQAAVKAGQALLAPHRRMLEQVNTVRRALKAQPSSSTLGITLLRAIAAEALGVSTAAASRRMLQDTSIHGHVERVLQAATAPEVWDPRDPTTTGGVAYHCAASTQGSCGTCGAFSAIGAAEIAVGMARKRQCPVQLSQQWMFFCNGVYFPTCDGWFPEQAADVLATRGAALRSCYPYYGAPGMCDNQCGGSSASMLPGKFTTQTFGPNDIDAAKQFIREKGGIFTFFDVYADFFDYSGGVYQQQRGAKIGGHAVVVVGYDDVRQAWIARNSWGEGWGEQGFFRISYSDPVFMKGYGANIIGVSYSEPNAPRQEPDAPSQPPSAPSQPDSQEAPPPVPSPPSSDPIKPAGNSTLSTLSCKVTLYDQPHFQGLSLTIKGNLTAGNCTASPDFSALSPSFEYRAESLKFSCTCPGLSGDACYQRAKDAKLFVWKQSFPYFVANSIAAPERGDVWLVRENCRRGRCAMQSATLQPNWVEAINSAALCYQKDTFQPSA